MIIQPISPVSQTNTTNQSSHFNIDSKEKKQKSSITENIEWYCNDCNKYFEVPEPVKYKFHPIDGAVECKVLNCPYCGSEHIINNREIKNGDKLWIKI